MQERMLHLSFECGKSIQPAESDYTITQHVHACRYCTLHSHSPANFSQQALHHVVALRCHCLRQ